MTRRLLRSGSIGIVALLTLVTLSACAPAAADRPAPTTNGGLGRVVALGEEALLADILALDVDVVASSASVDDAGFQGIDEELVADVEVLPMIQLDLEEVIALRPDTIITYAFWADNIGRERLEGIARVIVVPDGLTTPERVTQLGTLLGAEDEADGLLAGLETATAAAADAVPDDCRVSLATIYTGPSIVAFVDGPWDIPSAILSVGCELVPGSDLEHDQNGRARLSLEQLNRFQAPLMVLLQSSSAEGEDLALTQVRNDPLMATLPAVRAGNVHTFDRLGYPGAEGQVRFLGEFSALFR
ncbi:ABC transporter substrate-binding protein [Microbacterium sp. NPDC089189]|uniref:ABC transporter substrate-binding protein n=1 Tax=Microbacterium sp. NPDC089189 TaxID=3154972 RepID=UPI003447F701